MTSVAVERFALDQNFPPLIRDIQPLFPGVEIAPIAKIDRRLAEVESDRELVVALYQMGWTGLITNNYKMLYQPREIAAIVKTKLTVIAVRGVGDDPLRATGSIMTDFPAILRKVGQSAQGQVFLRTPSTPTWQEPWHYFRESARRRQTEVAELYASVRVDDDELASPVLG